MAFTINETPVHWDEVARPAHMPPWQEVVWIKIPSFHRKLWFVSKTGLSWQQRQREEIIRKGREILMHERDASS